MLTDERIIELWRDHGGVMGSAKEFARAVEREARREALEEAGAELYMAAREIERLRAERDELRALLREWRDINDGETGGNSWASLIDRTDAALAKGEGAQC